MDLNEKVLYADSIEFSYDLHKPLLTGVFIKCQIGDIIALLGRNGCGKSTLMQILFGSKSRNNGLIRINGIRVDRSFQTKKICYLPQSNFLPPYLKVGEVIRLMISNKEKQVIVIGDEIVKVILNQKIGETSVGERRYLELLILLQLDADFYLLDEPFSGVAPYLKDRIQELILSFQSHKGFIISDHHYSSVLEISTHILLLQNGGCRTISNRKELEMFYVPEGTFGDI